MQGWEEAGLEETEECLRWLIEERRIRLDCAPLHRSRTSSIMRLSALRDELEATQQWRRMLAAKTEKDVCRATLIAMGKAHLLPLLDQELMSIEELSRLKSENGRLNGALRRRRPPTLPHLSQRFWPLLGSRGGVRARLAQLAVAAKDTRVASRGQAAGQRGGLVRHSRGFAGRDRWPSEH